MIDDRDWDVLERLQEGIPLAPEPFDVMAAEIGMAADEFLQRTARLHEQGVIRRLGPRVRHHRVGIRGNIMVAWQVPAHRLSEVGGLFAADEKVSHCYCRPALDSFPYNLYTMVHAKDPAAAEQVVAGLAERSGLSQYVMLPTVAELKKTSPRYRRPD